MRPRSKLVVVTVVLLAGVAGALSFRRSAPGPTETSQPAPALERRSREVATSPTEGEGHLLGHIEPVGGESVGDNRSDGPVRPVPAAPASTANEQRVETARPLREIAHPSPAHPVTDMPADSPWGPSGRDAGALGRYSANAAVVDGAREPFHAVATARPGRTAYKQHRVADGDTLSSLAQHYLGDGGEWLAIYELNRDLLKDPDILPIGARIKVPEPRPAPPPADVPARGPQTSLASDRSDVEIQQFSRSGATTIAPLVSIAPGAYRSAREQARGSTYRVQPRDTLVSIARQFYGDESRYQAIYQANRQQIPDPNNLPAGVVLTIP